MADIQQPSVSTLSGEDVVEPSFIILKRPSASGFCVDLYLQVFDRVGPDTWHSLPEDQWHRLATIEAGWITMYPIYTNPHTQRYRDPKHGNVRCILYETKTSRTIPDTPDDAMLFIDLSLPRKLFNSCYEGLGLVKQLTPLWRGLRLAPIERVTMASMIDKFENMLDQQLTEGHWQQFFEANVFVLAMVFARPIALLHAQFHARGSMMDGAGAHIGDLLFAYGRELAIVEIKKPSTPLMQSRPYRNQDVYGPNLQLSGAITQVLHQQSLLRTNWLYHAQHQSMRDRHPDTARCIVIAGITPTEEGQRRSFELFRNACKDVEVITFDELLGKLRLLAKHLAPADPAPTSDVF